MTPDTAWHAPAALVALAGAASTAISVYVGLTVRNTAQAMKIEMADLRTEISEGRAHDRDELRAWINGSFLRAPLAEAEMKAFDVRVNHAEARIKNLERRAA